MSAKPGLEAAGSVVFIGAGPVGLWTAAQVKLHAPAIHVRVLEKYSEYQRRHILRIDPKSLRTPLAGDPRLAAFLDGLPPVVRTCELECRLSELATRSGVEVEHERPVGENDLRSPEALVQNGPSTLLAVVGADGAHSLVRRSLFADALSTYEEVMYACELKYEAEGKIRELEPVREAYPVLKLMRHAAHEYVGKPAGSRTPVTLRLIVSAAEFVEMSGATFREPFLLHLERDRIKIPAGVLESLSIWMNARAHITGEQLVPDSLRLSVTSLAPYRSAVFVRRRAVADAPAILVGDAAFGVPFFRSLNNGLLSGTRLAIILHALSRARNPVEKESALDGYIQFVERLAAREIRAARVKRSFLKTAKWWCDLSGRVPWQTIKISKAEVQRLRRPFPFEGP